MIRKVGDIANVNGNYDNVIDISDILRIIEGFKGIITKTDPRWKTLDLNGDGVIDISDIIAMINLSIFKTYQPFQKEITFADFAVKVNTTTKTLTFQVNMKKFDDDIHGIQMYVEGIQLKPRNTSDNYVTNKHADLNNWIVAANTVKRKGESGWTRNSLSLIYLEVNDSDNSGNSKLTRDKGIMDLCTLEYDLIDENTNVKFYSNTSDYQSFVIKVDGNTVIEKDFRVIL